MIMLIMLILSTWSSHSTLFVLYHLWKNNSYSLISQSIKLLYPKITRNLAQQHPKYIFSHFYIDANRPYLAWPHISILAPNLFITLSNQTTDDDKKDKIINLNLLFSSQLFFRSGYRYSQIATLHGRNRRIYIQRVYPGTVSIYKKGITPPVEGEILK